MSTGLTEIKVLKLPYFALIIVVWSAKHPTHTLVSEVFLDFSSFREAAKTSRVQARK